MPDPIPLIQIEKPELGRASDDRLTQDYIDARPELAGVPAFMPGVDVDLVGEINDRMASLHALVKYASPELAAGLIGVLGDLNVLAVDLADTKTNIEQAQDAIAATANSVPYANLAAFPASSTATRGAIALDTGNVYAPGGATWGAPIGDVPTGAQVQAAQATADSASARVQARLADLGSLPLTAGRVQTELGAFDIIPAAGQTVNGGTVRSIGIPNYVAKLGSKGPLDLRLFNLNLVGMDAAGNTAKLQAALSEVANNVETAVLDIPPGVMFFNGPGQINQNRQVSLRGKGIGTTLMVQTTDSHLFDVDLGGQGTFSISGLSLLANAVMTSGAAVNIVGGARLPAIVMRDIEIAANDGQWATGVRGHNLGEPYFDNVIAYGRSIAAQIADNKWFDAWHLTAYANAMDNKFVGCKVYKARYGIHAENAGLPGLEGLQLLGNDLVDVMQGVRFTNGAGYSAPQLSVIGGHMNYRQYGVFAQNISQVQIGQVLMYARGVEAGSGEGANLDLAGRIAVYVADSQDVQLHHLQLFTIFGGANDYDAIVLGNVENGSIDHIKAQFRDNTQGQLLYLAADTAGIEYDHLSRVGGVRTVSDNSPSNRPGRNLYPRDLEDVSQNLSAAPTLDLSSTGRTPLVVIGGTANQTVTQITGRTPGDVVTLQFDVGTTVNHVAGILLKGQAAATFSGGQTLTLYRDANGWREIARQ